MQFDELDLTERVVQSFSKTADDRHKHLLEELVRSLHDFVRKTDLSFEEWSFAIDFLTKTGQKCSPTRQEFILLSDVLGISMLVDAVNHRDREGATETTVLGPFYVGEHKPVPSNTNIAPGIPGKPLFVDIRVTSLNGPPVANAVVDVWHADEEVFYDTQKEANQAAGLSLRASFTTDADGRFSFRTILPHSYPIPTDGPVGQLIEATGRHPMRPAHIHFLVNAPGFEPIVTHVFIEGDEYLDSDAVFGVKEELVCTPERSNDRIMPDGEATSTPWFRMRYDFHVKKGEGHIPRPSL